MRDSKVRELWGRKFDVVNEGLDESQVAEFVDELIQQRDTILEQRDSLLSYIRHSKSVAGKEDELLGSEQQAENRAAGIVTEMGQDTQPEVEIIELERAAQSIVPEADEAGKEKPALHQDEVELAILPPVDADKLLQFQRRLRNSFQLKILSTDGSPSKGSLITVLLSEPQPLFQGLKQMPEVKKAVEELDTPAQGKGTLPSLFKNKRARRVWITLGKG